MRNYENAILEKYQEFLNQNKGISDKGKVRGKNKRFASYPFIGENYGKTKKVLFVGMDIGKDERDNIISLEERREDIQNLYIGSFNHHIAGTYFSALYYLKDELGLTKYWKESSKQDKFSASILNNVENRKADRFFPDHENINVLSYVALTNYYKFVTVDRENRSGDKDRVYVFEPAIEEKLLFDEVSILKPEVILFQGLEFNKSKYQHVIEELKAKALVYVGCHPAVRDNRKQPLLLVKSYQRIS